MSGTWQALSAPSSLRALSNVNGAAPGTVDPQPREKPSAIKRVSS